MPNLGLVIPRAEADQRMAFSFSHLWISLWFATCRHACPTPSCLCVDDSRCKRIGFNNEAFCRAKHVVPVLPAFQRFRCRRRTLRNRSQVTDRRLYIILVADTLKLCTGLLLCSQSKCGRSSYALPIASLRARARAETSIGVLHVHHRCVSKIPAKSNNVRQARRKHR